jgi:hypothetical protein
MSSFWKFESEFSEKNKKLRILELSIYGGRHEIDLFFVFFYNRNPSLPCSSRLTFPSHRTFPLPPPDLPDLTVRPNQRISPLVYHLLQLPPLPQRPVSRASPPSPFPFVLVVGKSRSCCPGPAPKSSAVGFWGTRLFPSIDFLNPTGLAVSCREQTRSAAGCNSDLDQALTRTDPIRGFFFSF